MLSEIENPRQNDNEKRRIFSDDYFDLYIWLDDTDAVSGFQLCYGKNSVERALTWRNSSEYSHLKVDDGEGSDGIYNGYKQKPMLVADGVFPKDHVLELFETRSADLPAAYRALVLEKIREFPGDGL